MKCKLDQRAKAYSYIVCLELVWSEAGVLIHMSIIWIRGSCSCGGWDRQTACQSSCVTKTLALNITPKLFNQICPYLPYLEAPLTCTNFYHFHWHWPGPVVSGSVRNRACWFWQFVFSHTFHLIRMKFDVVMKQFNLSWTATLLSSKLFFLNKGNSSCFTDCIKKI